MIKIFKTTKDGLEEIREIEKNCWVNFSNPTHRRIGRVIRETKHPFELLNRPLGR
jgi:hypothetical protein